MSAVERNPQHTEPGRQLRRHVAQRNVEAIVDAALSLLERDPKASLVEIAKAAGVSRPTSCTPTSQPARTCRGDGEASP